VYISRGRVNVKQRNAAIRRDYQHGSGVNELANTYRLTHRHIRRIVRE